MLRKTISSSTHSLPVSPLRKLSANGPFQLQVGPGVLAFCGSDAAKAFYPQPSGIPIPNAFDLIVNVAGRSGADREEKGVLYISLNESDVARYQAIAATHFPKVNDILTRGGRVLIHCEQGLTRSTTLVALYLTTYAGLSTGNALKQVKGLNNQAKPFQVALPKQTSDLESISEDD
jgi:Dual specificity phosphatase, catalytic domain